MGDNARSKVYPDPKNPAPLTHPHGGRLSLSLFKERTACHLHPAATDLLYALMSLIAQLTHKICQRNEQKQRNGASRCAAS